MFCVGNGKGKITETGRVWQLGNKNYFTLVSTETVLYKKVQKDVKMRPECAKPYNPTDGVALIPREVGSQWRDFS